MDKNSLDKDFHTYHNEPLLIIPRQPPYEFEPVYLQLKLLWKAMMPYYSQCQLVRQENGFQLLRRRWNDLLISPNVVFQDGHLLYPVKWKPGRTIEISRSLKTS